MPVFFLHVYRLRPLLRMMVLGMVCSWKMLAAQEIYDQDNRLFVAEGTRINIINIVASPQKPAKQKTRPVVRVRKKKWVVKADKKSDCHTTDKPHQADSEKPLIGFASKETSRLSSSQPQDHCGILVYPSSGKGKYYGINAGPTPLPGILYPQNIAKHKCLYRESYRRVQVSYSNSCRPPPNAPSDRVLIQMAAATGV